MVSVFEENMLDRAFGPWSSQTEEKKGVCCFSAKHEVLRARTNGIRIVLTASVIDHEFHPRSGQTEHNNIVVCCFSAALRDKNKYA